MSNAELIQKAREEFSHTCSFGDGCELQEIDQLGRDLVDALEQAETANADKDKQIEGALLDLNDLCSTLQLGGLYTQKIDAQIRRIQARLAGTASKEPLQCR